MKKKLLAALLVSALAAGLLPTSACAASDYTTANATLVTLTDSSATAKGKYTGYEIDGTDVSITAAGTYVFSGDCDNGSITVKKGVTGVTIVLNGLTLTNDDSAAITLNKTAEASLIAAAGTTNTVADTEGSNDENAAVKVKSGAALAIGGPVGVRIIFAAQRVKQLAARVPRVQRRHAQRRLLEAPRFRQLGHVAQLHAAQVGLKRALSAAACGERHAHAAVGFHVRPVQAQAIVAHFHVFRNSRDKLVVQVPRRAGRVRPGVRDERSGVKAHGRHGTSFQSETVRRVPSSRNSRIILIKH